MADEGALKSVDLHRRPVAMDPEPGCSAAGPANGLRHQQVNLRPGAPLVQSWLFLQLEARTAHGLNYRGAAAQ